MDFLPEIQEIIDRYAFEPPIPPSRPQKCHSNYLNLIGGMNDDYLRRLSGRCGQLANPLSYVEYTFKSSWSSGNSKSSGFCETCKEKIIESMLEECMPNKYDEDKEFIQTITSNNKTVYKRNSFIEILRRVVFFFKYFEYIPVLPAAAIVTLDTHCIQFYILFGTFIYIVYEFIKYC